MNLKNVLLALFLFVILFACDKDEPAPNPEIKFMTYENNSGEIGKAGGKIEITDESLPTFGISIEIPENALNQTKNIRIEKKDDAEIEGRTTSWFEFYPDNLEFDQEIKIGLPITNSNGSDKAVYYFDPDNGILQELENASGINSNSAYAYTTHFSRYSADDVTISLTMANAGNNYLAFSGYLIPSFSRIPFEDSFFDGYSTVQEFLENTTDANLILCLEYSIHTVNSLGIMGPSYMKKTYYLEAYSDYSSFKNLPLDSKLHLDIYEKENYNLNGNEGNTEIQKIKELSVSKSDFIEMWLKSTIVNAKFDLEELGFLNEKLKAVFSWKIVDSNYRRLSLEYSKVSGKFKFENLTTTNNSDADYNGIPDNFESNQKPNQPSNPTPSNGATGIGTNVTLQWECSDPEGDQLDYDIILEANPNPTRKEKQYHNSKSYTVSGLEPETTYYWKIWAYDSENNDTEGPVWSFTTAGEEKSKPTVETNDATAITQTLGTLNGAVISDGGATITERGFYWSESSFTAEDHIDKEIVFGSTGNFSYTLSNLTPGTIYYFRAYAKNSEGTTIGDLKSFTTSTNTVNDTEEPDINVNSPYNNEVLSGTVTLEAWANDNTGIAYVEFFIINNDWSNKKSIGKSSNPSGEHTYSLNWNSTSQTNGFYYIQAEAYDAAGNSSFDWVSVEIDNDTSGGTNNETGTFTDSRDGHTYKWVKIGEQVWMAENLAYDVGDDCWAYDNDESNVATYGLLYTWEAAKAACPAGWHLPTDEDWEQLAQYVSNQKGPYDKSDDMWYDVGKHLKATSGWNNDGNGTDDFGFSALPGGHRHHSGNFYGVGNFGFWWGVIEDGSDWAWPRGLDNTSKFHRYGGYLDLELSVRCIRD